MEFKRITIEDRWNVVEALWKEGIIDCDISFANLLCWDDSYPAQICRIDGFVIIRVLLDSTVGTLYTMPMPFRGGVSSSDETVVGETVRMRLLGMIEADAAGRGESLRIMAPTPQTIQEIRLRYPNFGFFYQRSHSDYIYLREDLEKLPGHKYQAKRNHIHKFLSEYEFTYEDLRAQDREECIELLRKWHDRRTAQPDVTEEFARELVKEEKSIRIAFDNFDALGLIGGAIRVEGSIVAFCYGSEVSDDTFCTHIEKADESYDGVFATINQMFAQHLPQRFKYINREDDLGLQGLRYAKETYHPTKMLHKYIATKMSPDMLQIKQLWLRCFPGDSNLDAEQFLLTQYSPDRMLAHYVDNRPVSMLHIIQFDSTAYLYAVATDPEFRHRGYAGKLMAEAINRCRQQGFSRVALIPEDDISAKWYAGMGFSGPFPMSFRTPEYDFGKCSGEADMAMVMEL